METATGMAGVLVEFIRLLVSGIGELAGGIGEGVNGFVQDLFLTVGTDGVVTGLSTFGGVVAIFGGIALATGITTLVFNWIRSIGN